ncbi:MAG: phosphate signaling complex protein PhoU [Anaerolineae bacterium]|nr:phosphate signaling complex protein PhoU [Anaerolineae bacterium]NIN98593.1 phosphate signaling complex protein PhoU [Anaerolineae bacterium]NIQ81477.1 phosphate signaling complex protein PhoU [Anaerolineae bacterium]
MPREAFDEQLKELEQELLEMGSLVDRAIDRSVQALADRDIDLSRQVIKDDEAVNDVQHDIEERCLVLIATQQPLASDLRVIFAIANIATELERMADHAKGIGQIGVMMGPREPLKPLIDIPRMAQKARWLLETELEAFVKRDVELARSLGEEDDEIDRLYDQVFRELLIFMMDDPRTITRATYLLWTAHNLERIADRAINIGERVVFLVTGKVEEHNV